MDDTIHERDYTKLALAHLCLGIVGGLQSGLAAALPHLAIGGVYLHIAIRRRPASGDTASKDL